MGKRKKSSRGPIKKKKDLLATQFQCLFCNHEKSVTVKLLKKEGFGQLNCKVCGQSYQTGINYLSAAIDVYSDWIDACDAVANGEAPDAAGIAKAPSRDIDVLSKRDREEEQGLKDDFIDDDEDDMAGNYNDDE